MMRMTGWMTCALIGISLGLNAQPKPQEKPQQTPDVIVFTNGDTLTGQLIRGVGSDVIFKSDMAGELTIPLSKVKELHSTGSFAVLKANAPVTRGELHLGNITVVGDKVALTSPIGGEETIPVKDVGFILDQPTFDKEVERKAGFFYGWTGAFTAGATMVQSTTHGGTFNTGLSLARSIPTVPYLRTRNRTLLNISETYGTLTTPSIPQTNPPTESTVKTSIFHSDAERDQYFSKRFYGLGTVSFDHNYSQGLELQSIFGGGVGWTPILTAKQQLDVKGDIHYEKQQFQDPTSNLNLIGSTIAEAYKLQLPKKMVFTETGNIIPSYNTPSAYSANFAAALTLPVWKKFAASVSVADNFLNNPSAGYKKNSFQFVTGVTYTIH